VINIPLGITGSETVKSDLFFIIYIDPETVFGIHVEGTKGRITVFSVSFKSDIQEVLNISDDLFDVATDFKSL
jgi:hypothetical protein